MIEAAAEANEELMEKYLDAGELSEDEIRQGLRARHDLGGAELHGHAEAVEVTYDPARVSYDDLLQGFWSCHNPTTLNRQGPDRGRQYRSIAFYKSEEEQQIIRAYIDALEENKVYDQPIVTEITPFTAG